MIKRIGLAVCVAILLLVACGQPSTAPGGTGVPSVPKISPSDLKLTGRMIYTGAADSIAEYDLSTNHVRTLFQAPHNAFVTAEAVSPDGTQVILSYAPPPPGTVQLGYSDLDVMPLNESGSPTPFLRGSASQEVYYYPAWSPDGKSLYYGHVAASSASNGAAQAPRIERIAYPGGQPEILVKGASYPRLSADGRKLVYITFNPDFSGNGLYVADADGSHAVSIVSQTDFTAIDSPIFSPDGQYVIFSAVGNGPAASTSYFTEWFGVQIAQAHNIPSDLWRVPVAGGKSQRLTNVGCTGLFASYSPDSRYIGFFCSAGIFVMNPDGTQLSLLNEQGGIGTMEWIP